MYEFHILISEIYIGSFATIVPTFSSVSLETNIYCICHSAATKQTTFTEELELELEL